MTIKKVLVRWMFGQSTPVESFTPGYRTIHPEKIISFSEWCKLYRVSKLYKSN